MEAEITEKASSFRSTQIELRTDQSKIATVHPSIPGETEIPNKTPATRGKRNSTKYGLQSNLNRILQPKIVLLKYSEAKATTTATSYTTTTSTTTTKFTTTTTTTSTTRLNAGSKSLKQWYFSGIATKYCKRKLFYNNIQGLKQQQQQQATQR